MTEPLVDRIVRRQAWLDPVGDVLQKAVGGIYGALGAPGRTLKDVMHGTRLLGHPLHPALTDVPIGAWLAGLVADCVAHYTDRLPTEAGDVALAVGLAAALPTVLSGLTDYHETFGHERRVGTSHGLAMVGVVALEATSLGLRWWAGPGAHAAAVGLSAAGLGLLLGGAYLGGHLVFGVGTMVNRHAFEAPPEDFTDVGAATDFPEGALRRVSAGEMPVLMVRQGGALRAIAAVCSHAGGPLDEGELHGEVVTCPWHGSRFRLGDGHVVSGPATFDQPTFTVREREGRVEVRADVATH